MIYLDYAATHPVDTEILDTFVKVTTKFFANTSSLHNLGEEASMLSEKARTQIANLLGCKSKEVIFTSGASEANNIAIKGVALKHQNRGKHIITSKIEHESTYQACKFLEEYLGFEISYLDVDKNGRVIIDDLKNKIRKDTILVTLHHVNNEIGIIQPIKEIGEIISKYPKCYFHVDATQSVGKINVHFSKNKIDMLTCSAHKMGGIQGSGLLLIKDNIEIAPLISGGSQEFNKRSGTQSTAHRVALSKLIRKSLENLDKNLEYVKTLNKEIRNEVKDFGVFNTDFDNSSPYIINLSIPTLKPETVLHALEKHDVYISTKSACSSKNNKMSRVLESLGVSDEIGESAIRISLSKLTTKEEITEFIKVFKKVITNLKEVVK